MALNTVPTHPSADSYVSKAEADAILANRIGVTDWTARTDDEKEALLKLATAQIDSFRFFGEKIFKFAKNYRDEQALQFPRDNKPTISGTADSATATSLVDAALASNTNYPDDFFNGWAIVIIEGTGRGQTIAITDFVSATGALTVAAWTVQPDSTSQYLLVPKIPQKVKLAVVEQALYLTKGGGDRARLQAEGVTEYKIGDLMEKFGGANMSAGKVAISNEARGYLTGLITRLGRII